MELLATIVVLCLAILAWRRLRPVSKKLPPGPTQFPIIGNLFQVGKLPHVTFAEMSKRYGPLMSIRLGSTLNVIVSSPELVKEMLSGTGFVGRYTPHAFRILDHDKFSMGSLPSTSSKWRELRKISREKIFANPIMEAGEPLRQEKLRQLLGFVGKCCNEGKEVNIRDTIFSTALGLLSATMLSADETGFDMETIEGYIKTSGLSNVADFFPILGSFDPQSVKRRSKFFLGKMIGIAKKHANERIEWRKANPNAPKKKDFLESFLDAIQGNEYQLDLNDFEHLLPDLYIGGSGSTAATIEWTMLELLLHREKLQKAKDEVRRVMGDKKLIDDSDISRLPYMQAVIKEVFRLHPLAPLLVPRVAEKDIEVGGYFIPKGTPTLFNVWLMGKDPNIWPNPERFEPERFLGSNIDYKGQHFQLIPFGAGRRMCPGIQFAHRVVHEILAALIGNFDWEFGQGEKYRNSEVLGGLALQREFPLKAHPLKPSSS